MFFRLLGTATQFSTCTKLFLSSIPLVISLRTAGLPGQNDSPADSGILHTVQTHLISPWTSLLRHLSQVPAVRHRTTPLFSSYKFLAFYLIVHCRSGFGRIVTPTTAWGSITFVAACTCRFQPHLTLFSFCVTHVSSLSLHYQAPFSS